jgi:hypothetical protein
MAPALKKLADLAVALVAAGLLAAALGLLLVYFLVGAAV